MGWTVLVTARAFWVSGAEARRELEAAGCRVVDAPEAGPLPEHVLIPLLQPCDAVIASNDPYTAAVFAACPRLKVVSRCGVGIDRIDTAAATEAGVVVANIPDAMTEAVADFTLALMLAVARRIPEGDALMRAGGWGEFPGVQLPGKTLGLVGFGQIGRAVARRALGFGMRLLACDPRLAGGRAPDPPAEVVSLQELLERSDFVSLHAPATPETAGLFGSAEFGRMKPTAYFINTARGALVDEAALVDALNRGLIAGAGIDVYAQEPCPPDHPLRRAPNTVLAPHNAFNSVEAAREMSLRSAAAILDVMRGGRPRCPVNPAVFESPPLRCRVQAG